MISKIVGKIFKLLWEIFFSIVNIALCVIVSINIANGAPELCIVGAVLFAVSAVLNIVFGIFDIKILINACVDADKMLEEIHNAEDKSYNGHRTSK